MGTRSTIALEFADGTVEQVYCHWDGYLSHNGKILQDHYSNPFKLRDLIDQGDLSSLGTRIGTQHPFSPHESDTAKFKALPQDEQELIKAATKAAYEAAKAGGACTFYGRDRGEMGADRKQFVDFQHYLAHLQQEEYDYILRCINGAATWFVRCYDTRSWITLEESFLMTKECE